MRKLSLWNWSDRTLNQISVLTSLKELNLSYVCITDTDLQALTYFSLIESLDISGCQLITDEGVQRLGRLDKLTYLNSDETKIYGESLYTLTQLDFLRLRECKNLKHKFPLCLF